MASFTVALTTTLASRAAAEGQVIPVAEVKRDAPVDFQREILPLLRKNCLACHNATTKESALVLETPQSILKGGDSGPAAMAKNAAESLILKRATGAVDSIMPPKDNKVGAVPLKPEELGLIKLWIDQGATGTVSGADEIQWQPLPGGVNPILAVAVSPDGQYAACGRANQIFSYDLTTGRLVCRLTDPELLKAGIYKRPGVADLDLIQSLAFSPDGSVLASGGYRTIKLWRRPRDVRSATFDTASPEGATAVATSADGKWLAAAGADHTIKLWDLATGQAARSLAGHTAAITSLRFSADGAKLFSASLDKSIRAWQVADGAAVGRIDAPTPVNALTIVGDGTRLATGGADNFIRLWSAPSTPARSIAGVAAPATAMAVSADRKLLAVAGAEGPIQIVDLAGGQVTKALAGHTGAVTALAFQANGARLASTGADKTIRVWEVGSGQPIARLEGGAAASDVVAVHPGGNQIVTGASDGSISIWKLDVPAARTLPGPGPNGTDEAPATVAAVSRDGKLLATAGVSGGKPAIFVRDVAAGAITKTLLGHDAPVAALAFSGDATKLASGSEDKTARVWNLADGAALGKFAGHTQRVTGVAFDSTGAQVVSGAADNSLKLWNAADGAELKNFAGHGGAITAVAMTSNNARVISASADQSIRLWNPADGQQVASIAAGAAVTALALARDDSRVAAALADNSIKLFQVADGKQLAGLAGHAAPVRVLSFSADNARLVSGGGDARAVVWDVARGAIVESTTVDGGLGFVAFGATGRELLVGSGNKLVQHVTLHFERPLLGVAQRISGLAYNNDGGLIYAASADGTLRGFQTGDGAQRFAAQCGAPVHGLALSPDGNWLASAVEDKLVRVWNAGNGAPGPKPQFGGFHAPVSRVAFSGDNQHVVGGSAAGEQLAFNLASGETVQAFAEQTGPVVALAAAGDKGDHFVAASADKTIRVWPLAAMRQISGHGQPVVALDTMPNAPVQIVSGSQDGTVRVWNADNGQQMQQLNHGAAVTSVAVRPDGQRIAAAGANNLVRLWNAQNFQQLAEMKGDYRAYLRIAATERLLTARRNEVGAETAAVTAAENAAKAEAENVKKATEAQAAAVKELTAKAEAAKKTADEKAAADKAAADEAAAAKKAEETKVAAAKAVTDATAAAKTAEETKLAAAKAATEADAANKAAADAAAKAKAAADGDANNQDLAKAKQAADKAAAEAAAKLKTAQETLVAAEKGAVEMAAKLKAAQEAMVAADKAAAEVAAKAKAAADAATAKAKPAADAEAARKVAETAKTATDKALEAANVAAKRATDAIPAVQAVKQAAEAKVKQVEADLEARKKEAAATDQPLRCVAFSRDNLLLVAAGDDKLVHTWSADTGAAAEVYGGQAGAVLSLAFAADGRIASGSADKSVVVFNAAPEWAWERTIGGGTASPLVDRVTALTFSPDGKLLASGGGDPSRSGELKIWNVADGALVRDFPDAHSDTVFGVDFSPEGNLIASCGADKFVKVFEVGTGKFVRSFEGHTHHVLGVRWRADGKVLASCGADNVIKVWDFTTGDQKTTIAGFGKEVTSIHFVGATSFVLSSSGDKTVRLHNIDNGQNVRNFGGGGDFMFASDATPDGKLFLAGGQDSVLREWNGENGQELRKFEPPAPPPTQQAAK